MARAAPPSQDAIATARPDIIDRNGEVLATDVKAPSLFAEPRRIIDKDEAIELLTATLPDLDTGEVRERLSSKKGFVWLKREITPQQQQEIHRLGIPGIGFLRENKRVYPTGAEVAHLIGLVNIDNQGIAGMEKWLDSNGLADLHRAGFATDRLQRPVELSVDLRVEHALRDELLKAKEKFHAKAASGLVSNVKTGEIVAMVSVPDFDPNNPKEAHDPDRINRLTTGVYEMGSTFKALDAGDGAGFRQGRPQLAVGCARSAALTASSRSTTTQPKGRFITHEGGVHLLLQRRRGAHRAVAGRRGAQGVPAQDRPARSAAHRTAGKRLADRAEALGRTQHRHHRVRPRHRGGAAAGGDGHQRAGQWRLPDSADLPEAHRGGGDGARQAGDQARDLARRCAILMRLNAEIGTAKKADVKGYYIGGKTGTAEKVVNGRYAKKRVLNAFTAILPADNPQYQLLVMLDEPQALQETYGFITSGWNAVPTGGEVIARIAPLLGIEPRFDLPPSDRLILAASKASQ